MQNLKINYLKNYQILNTSYIEKSYKVDELKFNIWNNKHNKNNKLQSSNLFKITYICK